MYTLEHKLDLTNYGNDWKHISDTLYEYCNKYEPDSSYIY